MSSDRGSAVRSQSETDPPQGLRTDTTLFAMALIGALLGAVAPASAQVGGPGSAYGTGSAQGHGRGHYGTAPPPGVVNGVPRVAPNAVLGWGGLPSPQYGNPYGPPPVYGPMPQPYYGPPGMVQGVPVAPGTIPGTVQVLPMQPSPYDPWAPR